MPTDHNISKLIINKLTEEQYEQAVKDADELYLTPNDSIDLPTQTGNAGKFLTTNGSTISWATVSAGDSLPSQSGNSGKFLTTDGTTASWANVQSGGDTLPDQTGNSGKFLTTNGATTSWAVVQGGGGASVVDTINVLLAPNTTSVSTGVDLSDDQILGVYIKGLYQIDSSDYTMSTSGGNTTIELTTASATTSNISIVYATALDLTNVTNIDYNNLSNKPQINGVTLTGNVSLSSLGVQSQNLIFENTTASTWVSDSTYSGYGYKCDLTCTGVTTNSYAQVIFNPTEATSGNYATICSTSTNTVTIYSKVNTSITIPTIIVMGA